MKEFINNIVVNVENNKSNYIYGLTFSAIIFSNYVSGNEISQRNELIIGALIPLLFVVSFFDKRYRVGFVLGLTLLFCYM